MSARLLIPLLIVSARVAIKKHSDAVSLTPIETVSLDLEEYFWGDAMRYDVETEGGNDTQVRVVGQITPSVTSFPLTGSKPSTSEDVLPAFLCNSNYHCFVSFSQRTVKVLLGTKTEWVVQWNETLSDDIAAVAVMEGESSTYVLAVTQAEAPAVFLWDSSSFTLLTSYSGIELEYSAILALRCATLPFNYTVAVGVRSPYGDRIILYNFLPEDSSLVYVHEIQSYQSIPGIASAPMQIVDFQVDCYLVVLDAEEGLIRFSLCSSSELSEMYLGMYPGVQPLALSNLQNSYNSIGTETAFFVLWTSIGAFYSSTDWLSVVGFFPAAYQKGKSYVTLRLDGNTLVAVSEGQLLVIKFPADGQSFALAAQSLSHPQIRSFAAFVDSGVHRVYRDLGKTVESIEIAVRKPRLLLCSVVANFLAIVTASSATGGSASLYINVTAIPIDSTEIYFGSGFRLSPIAQRLQYQVPFIGSSASKSLPVDSFFSGPELSFRLVNATSSLPALHPAVGISAERLVNQGNSTFQFGPEGVPILACTVSNTMPIFLAFSVNYIVLASFSLESNDITMRAIELDQKPVKCVASNSTAWVLAEGSSGNFSVYTIGLTIDPLSIIVLEQFPGDSGEVVYCKTMKLNFGYFMCVGTEAIFIESLETNETALVDQARVKDSKEWILADAVFASDNSALAFIADVSNGLNLIDLEDSFNINSRLTYAVHYPEKCSFSTSLYYENNKLLITDMTDSEEKAFSVYDFNGQWLNFSMALPALYGASVSAGTLTSGLFVARQNSVLTVFNLNTQTHNALYATLGLSDSAQVMVFPFVNAWVLVADIVSPNEYMFTLYIVLPPGSPYTFACAVFCKECFELSPVANVTVNVTISASNHWGNFVTQDLEFTFLNEGTFPSFTDSRMQISNVTMLNTNSTQLELWEVFEGNDVNYTVLVNGKDDNYDSLVLTISRTVQQSFYYPFYNMSCAIFDSAEDRIFFLCQNFETDVGEGIYVFTLSEESETLELEAKIDLGPLIEIGSCQSLSAQPANNSLVLAVLSCTYSTSNDINIYFLAPFLYNTVTAEPVSTGYIQTLWQCSYIKAISVGDGEFLVICGATLTITDSRFMLAEYSLEVTNNMISSLEFATMLMPVGVNSTVIKPRDFDILATNSSDFLVFLLDDESGLVVLQQSGLEFEVLRVISHSELRQLAGDQALSVRMCGSRLLVITLTHIIVYSLQSSDLQLELIIYPFNSQQEVTYAENSAFCFSGNESRYLAVVANHDTTVVRVVDFLSGGNSHILTDADGNTNCRGCGAFLTANWLLFKAQYSPVVTALKIAAPTLTVPALNHSNFILLNATWHTTSFTIQVLVSNSQGYAQSPNVTLRRVLLHEVDFGIGGVDDSQPWMLALYIVFLLLLAACGWIVIRKQSKMLAAVAQEDSDGELATPAVQDGIN